MAQRTITIVFYENLNLTKEEYADFGNGILGVLKMARPAGGFHLKSEGGTTVKYLNGRWAQHGGQLPWQ